MFSTTKATRDTLDCACSTVLPSVFETLGQILQNASQGINTTTAVVGPYARIKNCACIGTVLFSP
jgi:hypothetical protein